MCNNRNPPKIYVSAVPEQEIEYLPPGLVELTSGTHGYIVNDSIEGLSRPDADITISKLAGANASRISSSSIGDRNIVFDIITIPNTDSGRERLYNILPYDTMLRFYFVQGGKQVFIDGKIEKLQGTFRPGKPFSFQVSVLCPFPWFQSIALHTTQLKLGDNIIRNDGDIPSGFRMEVEGRANMVQLDDFKLTSGGDTFATKSGISAIAPVELNTFPGNRTFKCSNVPISGNKWKPSFYFLAPDSKFPKIPAGKSTINVSYSSAGVGKFIFDNLNTLYWRDTYSGV